MRHSARMPQWLVLCHLLSSVAASSLVLDPRYRSNIARQLDVVSKDNTCGLIGGTRYTCIGSENGDCCSRMGFCGNANSYCGDGCQPEFGTCGDSSISTDGSCGGSGGLTCKGATMGSCCSLKGFCGDTSDHCMEGCQSKFGLCGEGAIGSATEEEPVEEEPVEEDEEEDKPAESTASSSSSSSSSSKTTPPAAEKTNPDTSEPTDDAGDVSSSNDETDAGDDNTFDPAQSQGQGEGQNQQHEEESGGNNMGMKVGLGVGIPVGVIAIGGLAAWFLLKRRREAALAAAGSEKGAFADVKELETTEPATELYTPPNQVAVELPDQHYR